MDEDAHHSEAKVASLRAVEVQNCSCVVESEGNQEQKQVHLPKSCLNPCEVQFVGKEKECDCIQQKALEELKQLGNRKEIEDYEKKKKER